MKHFIQPRNNVSRYTFDESLTNFSRNWSQFAPFRPAENLIQIEYDVDISYQILDNENNPATYTINKIDFLEKMESAFYHSPDKFGNSAFRLCFSTYDELSYLDYYVTTYGDPDGIYADIRPAYLNQYDDYERMSFQSINDNISPYGFPLDFNSSSKFKLSFHLSSLENIGIYDSSTIKKEFTVMAWHKGTIFTGIGTSYGVYSYNGKALAWPFEPQDNGQPIPSNSWVHLVNVYQQRDDQIHVISYVDGVRREPEFDSSTNTYLYQDVSTTNVQTIGTSGTPDEETKVANIRLYNTALNDGEIQAIYNFENTALTYSPLENDDFQTI